MRVRGSQLEVPMPLEFGVDTVYKRTNIVAITTPDFTGFEYDEEEFSYPEYTKIQQYENDTMGVALEEVITIIYGGVK